MKKLLSCIISTVLIISSMTFVYAEDARTTFFTALTATVKELEKESEKIEAGDSTTKVLNDLQNTNNQLTFNLKLNSFESLYSSLNNTEYKGGINLFNMGVKNDVKGQKSEFNLEYNIPKEITEMEKDLSYKVDIYIDKEKIGVSLPNISDTYYYISRNDAEEFAARLGIDGISFKALLDALSNVQNATTSATIDAEKYKDIMVPYQSAMAKALVGAEFELTGKELVDSSGKLVQTKKVSTTLTAGQIDVLLFDIAEALKADKLTYELFSAVYSPYNSMYAMAMPPEYEGDMAAFIIDQLVASINEISLEKVVYTAYINDKNLILSHKFDIDVDEYSDSIIRIDTKGADYLLNDIAVDIADKYDDYTSGVRFAMIGNYVPKAGAYDSAIRVTSYSRDGNKAEELNPQSFVMEYKWEPNKSGNNFKFDMGMEYDTELARAQLLTREEFDEMYPADSEYPFTYEDYLSIGDNYGSDELGFNINAEGRISADSSKKTMVLDINSINVYIPYAVKINMGIEMDMGPLDSNKIAMEGEQIDLNTLTDEEIGELMEEITSHYQLN